METVLSYITSPFAGVITFGILSIIIFILIRQLSNKNKTIREINAEKDKLTTELLSFDPFSSHLYGIIHLSNCLEEMVKIKGDKFFISKLFSNATQVFCKKFDSAQNFSEIKFFIVDMCNHPHLYNGLIKAEFFEKTHKKVRELTEQYFEELKTKKDKKGLQDLSDILKKCFGNYEDLYASFYYRINQQLSLPT